MKRFVTVKTNTFFILVFARSHIAEDQLGLEHRSREGFDVFDLDRLVKRLEARAVMPITGQHGLENLAFQRIHVAIGHHRITHIGQDVQLDVWAETGRDAL